MVEPPQTLKDSFIDLTELMAAVLMCSWGMSWLASFYWVFDLFSHFLLQYTIGGVLIGAVLLAFKRWKWGALAVLVALASLVEARLSLDHPLQLSPPALTQEEQANLVPVTLVQFNQHVLRREYSTINKWLHDNADKFDVVVLQEAAYLTADLARTLKDLYPHQVLQPRDHAFGMVILSRYELAVQDVIPVHGPQMESFILRLSIQPPGAAEPLVIYAVHALPPGTPDRFKQRNIEVLETAKLVAEDTHDNVAMIGDWNLTPFSPFFSQVREVSGLQYQSFGLMINVTWPTFLLVDIFRIPIDHALTSPAIRLIDKQVGPAWYSDHHALIVKLGLKKKAAPE